MTKQQRAKWNTTRVAYEQKREQIRQRLKRFENMGLRFKAAPKRPLKRITKASVRRLEKYNEYLDTIYEKQTGKKPPKPYKPKTQKPTKPIQKTKPTKSIQNTQPTKSIISTTIQESQQDEDIPTMADAIETKIENILDRMEVHGDYGEEVVNGTDWKQLNRKGGGAREDFENWVAQTPDTIKASIYKRFSDSDLERALLDTYGSEDVELYTDQHYFHTLLSSLGVTDGSMDRALNILDSI